MMNINLFPVERNRYFTGKLLTVRDFETEQNYMNNKRRLLNRLMHGAGVVCGLGVTQSDDTTFILESGMAIDYLGREVVVDTPVIKRLQMLEGYSEVLNSNQAFLCLKYEEKPSEGVNAVGADSDRSMEYNKVMETYSLYLDKNTPDIATLLDADARTVTAVLYENESEGIRLALTVPRAVSSGEDFFVEVMLMKGRGTPPIEFKLEMESDFFVCEQKGNGISLEFKEPPWDERDIYRLRYKVRASPITDMMARFAKSGKLDMRSGDIHDRKNIDAGLEIYLCTSTEVEQYFTRNDSLKDRLAGRDLPIYLAKLDMIPSGDSPIISGMTSLPFMQRARGRESSNNAATATMNVSTHTDILKSWQMPEVSAEYHPSSNLLHLRFGLPMAESDDYTTSTGVINIPMTRGMRVGARYFSDEVPHNLGFGDVAVQLAIEFDEDGDTRLYFGEAEVFRSRNGNKSVPAVKLGAILYPERGTIQVGVWLMDEVETANLRVRFFASKMPSGEDVIKQRSRISVRLVPEVQRIKVRERIHLKAVVSGTDDKRVIWSVKDAKGGTVDKDGLYQAPDVKGTYEIVATSEADPSFKASTFAIVEE